MQRAFPSSTGCEPERRSSHNVKPDRSTVHDAIADGRTLTPAPTVRPLLLVAAQYHGMGRCGRTPDHWRSP